MGGRVSMGGSVSMGGLAYVGCRVFLGGRVSMGGGVSVGGRVSVGGPVSVHHAMGGPVSMGGLAYVGGHVPWVVVSPWVVMSRGWSSCLLVGCITTGFRDHRRNALAVFMFLEASTLVMTPSELSPSFRLSQVAMVTTLALFRRPGLWD